MKCHFLPDLSLCFLLFRSVLFLSKLIVLFEKVIPEFLRIHFFEFLFCNILMISAELLFNIITPRAILLIDNKYELFKIFSSARPLYTSYTFKLNY